MQSAISGAFIFAKIDIQSNWVLENVTFFKCHFVLFAQVLS